MHMSTTRRNILVTSLVALSVLAAFAAPAAGKTFTHRLTGTAEVPGPGDADGRGSFTISVYPLRHELCYRLHWEAIASPTAAHIHRGRVGVAGDVRLTLFSQTRPLPRSIHTVAGCIQELPTRLLNRIQNDPTRFYVNVHNRPFPDGALRGQLA
jgi:hypothetical protein